MEEKLSDELKCPICFEIPPHEVYQCRNGHAICNICVRSILECPQCRVPFQSGKIRNRALESLLDKLELDCPYKAQGCNTKILRGDVSSHQESCAFNRSNIKVCQHLGLPCEYVMSDKNFQDALAHFRREHGFIVWRDDTLDIRLEGFSSINRNKRSIWTPAILDLDSVYGIQLLVVCLFDPKDKTISVECLRLNKNAPKSSAADMRAEFIIKSFEPAKTLDLIWSTPPLDLRQAMFTFKPYIRYDIDHLCRYMIEDSLLITCNIFKRNSVSPEHKAGTVCTFNIPSVDPIKVFSAPKSSTTSSKEFQKETSRIVQQKFQPTQQSVGQPQFPRLRPTSSRPVDFPEAGWIKK